MKAILASALAVLGVILIAAFRPADPTTQADAPLLDFQPPTPSVHVAVDVPLTMVDGEPHYEIRATSPVDEFNLLDEEGNVLTTITNTWQLGPDPDHPSTISSGTGPFKWDYSTLTANTGIYTASHDIFNASETGSCSTLNSSSYFINNSCPNSLTNRVQVGITSTDLQTENDAAVSFKGKIQGTWSSTITIYYMLKNDAVPAFDFWEGTITSYNGNGQSAGDYDDTDITYLTPQVSNWPVEWSFFKVCMEDTDGNLTSVTHDDDNLTWVESDWTSSTDCVSSGAYIHADQGEFLKVKGTDSRNFSTTVTLTF